MRLKIERAGEGLHPSEIFVTIRTEGGVQEVAVDPKSLQNGSLPVGWPVGKKGEFLLVELPRPTVNGARRVWVKKEELLPDKTTRKTA
jgi:hypothetical protein